VSDGLQLTNVRGKLTRRGWQQFKIEPVEARCFDSRVDRQRHHVDIPGINQDAGQEH